MEVATKEACSALSRAVDDMAHFYDAHQREAPLYAVGDKVWLNGQNITTNTHEKLDHKGLGPYCEGDTTTIHYSCGKTKTPLSLLVGTEKIGMKLTSYLDLEGLKWVKNSSVYFFPAVLGDCQIFGAKFLM